MLEAAVRACRRARITIAVDNYVDALLPDAPGLRRAPRLREGALLPPLWAEHGLALVLELEDGSERHRVLFDAGWSPQVLAHNLEALGIDPRGFEVALLSHGHMDHWGGLQWVRQRCPGLPVVLHPGAFARRVQLMGGLRVELPRLEEFPGARAVSEPTPLCGGLALTSGEIPRRTPFERPPAHARVEVNGQLVPDAFPDDQALGFRLAEGLVVVSGCAHAGIVNTIRRLQEVSGCERLWAVVGGFHLAGAAPEALEATLEELGRLGPEVICPLHCTGPEATRRLREAFPRAFRLGAVGTTLLLP